MSAILQDVDAQAERDRDFRAHETAKPVDRRVVIARRQPVRWPQVDERRENEGRRFTDVQPVDAMPDPADDDRPYSPCRWADVPTTGFL